MPLDDRTPPPHQVGALLRIAWEEVLSEVAVGVAEAGFDGVRPHHYRVLRRMLVEGLRPSDLAAFMGLSKQAANDLVREFEANGYITLEPDPDDGRAKRIRATDRGWELAMASSRLAGGVANRWAEQVGEERYAIFEQVLREIVAAGELDDTP